MWVVYKNKAINIKNMHSIKVSFSYIYFDDTYIEFSTNEDAIKNFNLVFQYLSSNRTVLILED